MDGALARAALGVALVALVAACGPIRPFDLGGGDDGAVGPVEDDPAPITALDAEQLGACFTRRGDGPVTGPGAGDGHSLVGSLLHTDAWRRSGPGGLTGSDARRGTVDLRGAVTLAGESEETAAMHRVTARRAVDASRLGADVHLGTSTYDGRTVVVTVVVAHGHDEITFVGDCEAGFTEAFATVADELGTSPRATFDAVVAGDVTADQVQTILDEVAERDRRASGP